MKGMLHKGMIAVLIIFVASLAGCSRGGSADGRGDAVEKAIAVLHPTTGNTVFGTVAFTKAKDGVRVAVRIEGLPAGPHGFHIHEYGDCSSPDGTSAGGHFNPDNAPHAGPTDKRRHVGDLGNIVADNSGVATLDVIDPMLAFEGKNSIIGRSVIVHADPDDFTTQPTGGAGARLACGVIGIPKH
jgi:superoxide dismutase, Cu-Zn family